MVLVTKYRKKLLPDFIADDGKQRIYDICHTKGYGVMELETDKDQIHFLVSSTTIQKYIKSQG